MGLGVVSPVINRGVRSNWLQSLPGSTQMLTVDSSGNVASQAIPSSATWGSITGTLSSQTDLQTALNAKANLSGATFTGAISGTSCSFSGTVAGGAATFSSVALTDNKLSLVQISGYVVAIRAATSWSAEPLLTGYPWHFAWSGDDVPKITMQTTNSTTGVRVASDSFFAFTNSTNSRTGTVDLSLFRDAANTLGIRNSTNAQRVNLYGTYTDGSNYRRLFISSTTAGAFTIGVEGAGTGASGNTLSVSSTILPSANGTHNLGSSGLRFLDIFCSRYCYIGNGIGAGNCWIYGEVNGSLRLLDGADAPCPGILLGTANSSNPFIKRLATPGIAIRNGNDTSDAALTASNLTLSGNLIESTPTTPASASATGTTGTITWDTNYIYVCTATNTWKRVAIATW